MNAHRSFLAAAALSCMVLVLAPARAGTPSWVEKRPSSAEFYIGIGSAEKRGTPDEYTLRAKHTALNDIASQIVVAISGEQISRISEQMGKITDDYQTQIRSTTSAELEGVESVDTYESDTQLWVYLRLNIAEYQRLRQKKMQQAATLAFDYFTKGRSSEKEDKGADAIRSYLQALSAVSKYIAEPIERTYEGRKIFLVNEIIQSLQTVLNSIEIEPKNSPLEAQVGKPIKVPVEFTVRSMNAKGQPKPCAMLPVRFSFLRGKGELVQTSSSDQAGIASTRVAKITATDKLQMIAAGVDLQAMLGSDPVMESLVKGFTVPGGKTIVNVAGISVFIRTQETQFGSALRLPRIEPVLKGMLSSEGFSFTKTQGTASISIDIKADSRQGSSTMGLCVAYADATVSVIDLTTGDEIYKNSVSNLKGVSDTYDKAGMKALDEAASVLKNEVIPLLLEKYRK